MVIKWTDDLNGRVMMEWFLVKTVVPLTENNILQFKLLNLTAIFFFLTLYGMTSAMHSY